MTDLSTTDVRTTDLGVGGLGATDLDTFLEEPAVLNGVSISEISPVAEMQFTQTPTLFESTATASLDAPVAALEAVVTKKHTFDCANLTRGGVCDC